MPYKNPEDTKRYREQHRAEAILYAKAYRESHSKEMAQYKKDWVEKIGQKNITKSRREYHRKRYQANRELYAARQRACRKARPERNYARQIKKSFNMTLAEKWIIYLDQDRKCKICKSDIEFIGSHIDHIHHSNPVIIRGLLCGHCNRGLGCFMDSQKSLHEAINYLNPFQPTPEISFTSLLSNP